MSLGKLFIPVLAITLGVVCAYYAYIGYHAENTIELRPRINSAVKLGGPFTLVDDNGEGVTEETFADRDMLLFFGFTSCPSICPAELQKMAETLNLIGDYNDKIYPVFVTVDPERDTPSVIKAYLDMFHPDIIGLTGTEKQIEKMETDFKVYSLKVDDPSFGDYTMDHSAYIYLYNVHDGLINMYKSEDSPAYIAADLVDYYKKTE